MNTAGTKKDLMTAKAASGLLASLNKTHPEYSASAAIIVDALAGDVSSNL